MSKKQKPLSKTQGGNWWVVRQPNGSIISSSLARTQGRAWNRFMLMANTEWGQHSKERSYWHGRGFTCEQVQICSIGESESPHVRTKEVIIPNYGFITLKVKYGT